MNYYFLPGVGIFGGIKVGFQFADMLNSLGIRIVVATPGARGADWFKSSAAIVDRDLAIASLTSRDAAFFSLPADYPPLRDSGAQLVFHCQGTDPDIDQVLADEAVLPLACWTQAREYMEAAGRQAIDVGISVSDCFFYDGTPKAATLVAYMPRRGADIATACMATCPELTFVAIDGAPEAEVSDVMKSATYFLATSEGEWFGLPALEAMASGCLVVSVPTLGGMEYLRDGSNSLIGERAHLPGLLSRLSDPSSASLRARLYAGSIAAASHYRTSLQADALRLVLQSRLKGLSPWS